MKYVALDKVDNDILIRGDGCITTLKDLYTALVDTTTTEIELRKSFVDKYFTYTALCDFVSQSASIAPNVRIYMDGVIYDTTIEAVQELKSYTTPDEFIYALGYNPTRVLSTIKTLCNSYVEAHNEQTLANNKMATMLVQIDDLVKRTSELENENSELRKANTGLNAHLHSLVSRVNFKYDKAINVDEMFLLGENKYNHILYIKEITRVHYLDTLVYYIEEIMKTMYGVPVRTVVIEPYYSYGCETRYPGKQPHWDLTYRDVFSGDILMAGFQPKLMKDILQNSNHVNYLIIIDRGGYKVPHVQYSNVSTVYTVSDLKDKPDSIRNTDVISYSTETLNIPYIPDFNNLSPEDKIKKYSSMPVTKQLINLLEEVK